MPIVKITRNRQVTIPKELFEQLDLHQGAYVEISRDGDQLILRPKELIDRQREDAKQAFFETVDRIWERNRDVDPERIEREVEKALDEVRDRGSADSD